MPTSVKTGQPRHSDEQEDERDADDGDATRTRGRASRASTPWRRCARDELKLRLLLGSPGLPFASDAHFDVPSLT